jgi:ABC-type transport system involved in multi-copper enzyme maturation permease subunit
VRYTLRPRFDGLVRADLIKVSRQWMTWLLALLVLGFVALGAVLVVVEWHLRGASHRPADLFAQEVSLMGQLVSSGAGILLLAVTSRAVAQDFQAGTIRLFVARGAGRVRFLLAKLAAAGVVAAVVLAGAAVLAALVSAVLFAILTGGLGGVPASSWSSVGPTLLAAAVSLTACILLGFAAAGIGRSMVFGLAGALIVLPADNLVNQVLNAAGGSVTALRTMATYQIGYNLSALPSALQTARPVTAAHALLVTACYAVVLLAVPLVLFRLRDVHE